MKIISFLSIAFAIQLSASNLFAQNWTTISSPSPVGTSHNAVHFTNSNRAYIGGVLGFNGNAIVSYDGGLAFYQNNQVLNVRIYDVFFTSTTNGHYATSEGVHETTNAGSSFTQIASPPNFKKVMLTSSSAGFAVNVNGVFVFSAGAYTNQIPASFGVTWASVFTTSSSTAWIVGSGGTINGTTDGGTTWNALTSGTTNDLNDIHFVNTNLGFAVGNSGTILKTVNGGSTWTTLTSNTTNHLYAVDFVSSTVGYAVGANGTILKTTDAGANWTVMTSNTTNTLRDVDFLNPFVGIAVGENNTILRFQDPNCGNTGTDSQTSCGDYYWGNQPQALTSSGTYTRTFINQYGCDSLVTLNLTVFPTPQPSNLSLSSCGEPITVNSETYTTSGNYTQIVQNANGCDSTININALITDPTVNLQNNNNLLTAVGLIDQVTWLNCDLNYSIIAGQNNPSYSPSFSGSYSVINNRGNGCIDTSDCVNVCIGLDNNVGLNGNVLSAQQNGATYQWLNCVTGNSPIVGATSQTYTVPGNGSYAVAITLNGCTAQSNCIDICVIDQTISMNGNTLTSNDNGANTYQWYDCSNGNLIAGATSQSFTPTQSGSYNVEITQGNCLINTSCEAIILDPQAEINENAIANFRFYPNPSSEEITLVELEIGATITLLDASGRVINQLTAESELIKLEVSHFTDGVYFIQVNSPLGSAITKKLIVRK